MWLSEGPPAVLRGLVGLGRDPSPGRVWSLSPELCAQQLRPTLVDRTLRWPKCLASPPGLPWGLISGMIVATRCSARSRLQKQTCLFPFALPASTDAGRPGSPGPPDGGRGWGTGLHSQTRPPEGVRGEPARGGGKCVSAWPPGSLWGALCSQSGGGAGTLEEPVTPSGGCAGS